MAQQQQQRTKNQIEADQIMNEIRKENQEILRILNELIEQAQKTTKNKQKRKKVGFRKTVL